MFPAPVEIETVDVKGKRVVLMKKDDTRSLAEFYDTRSLAEFYDTRSLAEFYDCLLYTSPSPRDRTRSRMPSSA